LTRNGDGVWRNIYTIRLLSVQNILAVVVHWRRCTDVGHWKAVAVVASQHGEGIGTGIFLILLGWW